LINDVKSLYRRVFRYSRPYFWRVLLAMLGSLLVSGSDVTLAKLVKPFVDDIFGGGDPGLLIRVPFFVVGLALIKASGRYFQAYFIKTAGMLVVQDIRKDLYCHSLSLSMGYYSRSSTGNVMSRILNDVGILQRTTADVLVDGVREGATLIGLTVVAFTNDWQLASMAFLVLPLSIFPANFVGRKIKNYTRRGQAALGVLTRLLQETLAGIKVIKAFGSEDRESRRFVAENRHYYRFFLKMLKYDALAVPAVNLLTSIGIGTVLWFGCRRVLDGAMTKGELTSFLAAMLMMYVPLKQLIKVSNILQRSVGAAERIFELMDESPEISETPGALALPRVQGVVEFDSVDFAYEKEPVLQGFSLRIAPGEVVALVGPSGGGKSTIIGLLTRFYDPQQGRILIDGYDIRSLTIDSLKQNIALVDQETFLFNDTIRNNIRYGQPDVADAEVERAAGLAYADEFIRAMPQGYDTVVGDRGLRLSGGQRQRLCIARAILRDAPILLLDEATSALDTESEAIVQKALENLMQNRATIVVAHRLSTIMHADKIVVLEKGQVRETGRHFELLEKAGPYQRLYNMQFQSSGSV
jgi:subfamily B ATP-binding cassette protein MsbA